MPENRKDSIISSILPALTGLVALLIGNGIGRLGYPPLIPALVDNHWFTLNQAYYMGAGNLTGYIIGSALASRINQHIPSALPRKRRTCTDSYYFCRLCHPLQLSDLFYAAVPCRFYRRDYNGRNCTNNYEKYPSGNTWDYRRGCFFRCWNWGSYGRDIYPIPDPHWFTSDLAFLCRAIVNIDSRFLERLARRKYFEVYG